MREYSLCSPSLDDFKGTVCKFDEVNDSSFDKKGLDSNIGRLLYAHSGTVITQACNKIKVNHRNIGAK